MKDKRFIFRTKEQEDVIPEFLHLLDFVSSTYSLEKKRPFQGYKIMAVQHLLGSTLPFFNMLEKGGANPKDIYIVGKAYSSHPLVVELLQKRGYQIVFDDVYDFAEDKPYDSILEKHIIGTCATLLKEMVKNQKGLIIDDGGKAIELLHNTYFDYVQRFVCVEQTSRGARTLSTVKISCPVINVARSDAKTLCESLMIARAMVNEFFQLLRLWEKANVYSLADTTVLLLGYGFIGKQVAKQLVNYGFIVTVYDSDENRQLEAARDGLKSVAFIKKAYSINSIIIGCTGTPVISDEELELLKSGTLLVNMASTDLEFRAWTLRPRGKIIHQQILPSDIQYMKDRMPLSWRSLYKIELPQGYLYLANGGFPCDFSGKINPVPAKDIQLTSGLLLGGAIQAVYENRARFVDLDVTLQQAIVAEYLKVKS